MPSGVGNLWGRVLATRTVTKQVMKRTKTEKIIKIVRNNKIELREFWNLETKRELSEKTLVKIRLVLVKNSKTNLSKVGTP